MHHYALLVLRIFSGTHSGAASANSFSHILAHSRNAVLLHNEIALITGVENVLHNLPEIGDEEGELEGLRELWEKCTEMGGMEIEGEARREVMQMLGMVVREREEVRGSVGGLVGMMGGMNMEY